MSDPILSSAERPVRDHMNKPGVKWRHGGPPNYDKVDRKYLTEKTKSWRAGSLEKVVENLVKSWEMESSHKVRIEDWGTVDPKKFTIVVNGTRTFDLKDNIEIGNYNMSLYDCVFHDNKTSNDKTHDMFKSCFPGGFAWELTELFQGPPTVMFNWHHWATYEGDYGEHKPTGEQLELYGFCAAHVNSELKVEKLEVWFDPNPMMAKLCHVGGPCNGGCPISKTLGK